MKVTRTFSFCGWVTTSWFVLPFSLLAAEPIKPTEPAKDPKYPAATRPQPSGSLEVRFTDDSTLKLMLRDEMIEFNTAFGKLLIPVADIRRIEMGVRLSEEVKKRIDKAVANLGSQNFKEREAASVDLLGLKEKAYPALVKASKHTDTEIKGRAQEILGKLRESVPEDKLLVRLDDVVHTAEGSKLPGRLSATVLKVHTTQFGDLDLKIADVRSFNSSGKIKDNPKNVLPDPGTLQGYQNQIGQTFYFKVTGGVNGSVWGTDMYTTDSTLAAAAVHVGALKQGEAGIVKVTIVASPPSFQGSTRNGVTTGSWGVFDAAYQVSGIKEE